MSLHANLRAVDRNRATRALTAWTCDDREALDQVLTETAGDPIGANGLVFGLLSYADWIANNTGPVLPGDPGPDRRPDELS